MENHLLEMKWKNKDYQLFFYQQPVGTLSHRNKITVFDFLNF